MEYFNYLADSTETPLNSNIFCKAHELQEKISSFQKNQQLYHGLYDFEFRDSLVQYNGLLRPASDTIRFDFDCGKGVEPTHEKLCEVWEQVKRFCLALRQSGVDYKVYFSGYKGFHVEISAQVCGVGEGLKQLVSGQVKSIYMRLQKEYPFLDAGIWDSTRKFRAFKSKHKVSGLFKSLVGDAGAPLDNISITQIKDSAKVQPKAVYSPPKFNGKIVDWLKPEEIKIIGGMQKAPSLKEIPKGHHVNDDSLKFSNFGQKTCIKKMKEVLLPQFNRHDIEVRICHDLFYQGVEYEEARKQVKKWADKTYGTDIERVAEADRTLRDAYQKDAKYSFGCYDEVKKAYCSAKCFIYKQLNPESRAEAMDCSKAQIEENRIRHDPMLKKSEGEIADIMMSKWPQIIQSAGEYFKWVKTHWEKLDKETFEAGLWQAGVAAYSNKAQSHKIESLIKQVKKKIPVAPETNNLFSLSLDKFNFTDLTVKVIRDDNGGFTITKYSHSKEDYLSYCHQFPFETEHGLQESGDFATYLKSREQDGGEETIRVIKEMLGAALIPYVPRIFFCEGRPNSGKSTLAYLISKLLGEQNISHVQPVLKGGGADRFNWEPSIGKIANIVTELERSMPVDVNTLKSVRDKQEVDMDRKKEKHVKAVLPFFHMYCCNQMPPSLEGNSGALDNRITYLKFTSGGLPEELAKLTDLGRYIWDRDAGGVLNAAREGVRMLLDSGFKYSGTERSRESVKQWQKQTDQIQQFFEDISTGEFQDESCKLKFGWELGKNIYVAYDRWSQDAGRKKMGKHAFYKELREKRELEFDNDGEGGVRFFLGKKDDA